MITSILAMVAFQAGVPSTGASQVSGVEADERCLAAIAYAAQNDPEADRGSMEGAILYFVGRIDARSPGLDVGPVIRRMLSDSKVVSTLLGDANRCGAMLQAPARIVGQFVPTVKARAGGR